MLKLCLFVFDSAECQILKVLLPPDWSLLYRITMESRGKEKSSRKVYELNSLSFLFYK